MLLPINLGCLPDLCYSMRLVTLLLLACAVSLATTLINPNFGASDPLVVGDPLAFDPQSVTTTASPGGQVTVVIDLDFENGNAPIYNSGGAPGINQFIEPYGYALGDLFFFDPSAPTTTWTTSCEGRSNPTLSISNNLCVSVPTSSSLAYGLVLDGNINGLTSGDLYQIAPGSTNVGVEDAESALGNPTVNYRPTEAVFAIPNSPGNASGIYGTEAVCTSGPNCNTNGAQYQITLSFSASTLPAWFVSEINNGQIGLEFSAADCGNAVIVTPQPPPPPPSATPELGTLAMIATGLGFVGFGVGKRGRRNLSGRV